MNVSLLTTALNEALGFLGIAISGLCLVLAVVFSLASVLPVGKGKRRFTIPFALAFAGATVDRWLIGGTFISSVTRLDMDPYEKVMSACARAAIVLALLYLLRTAYRIMVGKERLPK